MTKNKKITLEGLAFMIAKGFEGVDKRFDQTNEGFGKGFDLIDKRLELIERKLIL